MTALDRPAGAAPSAVPAPRGPGSPGPGAASRLRIALVCVELDPTARPGRARHGRVGEHVAGLARALGGTHDVVVETCTSADPETDDLATAGVRRHEPGGPLTGTALDAGLSRLVAELTAAWRTERPHAVHAPVGPSALVATAVARELDLPLVLSLHEPRSGRRARSGALLARRADRVVVPSSEWASELVRDGVDRSVVRVVPPGVDADALIPAGPGLRRGDRPRLVALGGIGPGSGIDDLITAMRSVPAAELFVAGGLAVDGDDHVDAHLARCVRTAERVGVADRIRFLGAVPRGVLGPLLRSADAVVHVPRWDASGLPALEAMACGRAVVATAVGVLNDIVADRVTGLLVAPGHPAELARVLHRLLGERTRLDALGVAGRDRVLARFTWDLVGAATADVLREAAVTRAV